MESKENEFFGLNTTVFKNEGILTGAYNKLEDYYKNTAEVSCQLVCINCLYVCMYVSLSNVSLLPRQDYLSDVYTDALDDYLGGLIQVDRMH